MNFLMVVPTDVVEGPVDWCDICQYDKKVKVIMHFKLFNMSRMQHHSHFNSMYKMLLKRLQTLQYEFQESWLF